MRNLYIYISLFLTDPYEMFAIDNITAVVYNIKPLVVDVPTLTVVVLVSFISCHLAWFSSLGGCL